jgi:hypothetical protein
MYLNGKTCLLENSYMAIFCLFAQYLFKFVLTNNINLNQRMGFMIKASLMKGDVMFSYRNAMGGAW